MAAPAEPVQDSLATLLAAQADFLKQVQSNAAEQEAQHAEHIARLDATHREQMAELFRRVSAPQLSWGQPLPAGLLRFGEENAAQCASEPEEELGEHGLAELAIGDRDDSMGADGGDSDSASPDASMTMAGPVTHETTEMTPASTDVSPARPPGPGRAPTRARARGSGHRRPKGEDHYRQNPKYVRALQLYLEVEGRLSAEECLKAAGFDRITDSEKDHLRRLARQAKAADPTTGGVAVAVASRKGSKAKTASKTLPNPFRLTRKQVRRPLGC
jgi:hypothetical protein